MQELLVGMRDEYVRKLPGQLTRIEWLWFEMTGGIDSRKDELLRAAHSMAGAAGTFGLPEVGSAALELERALQPVCTRGGTPNDGERSHIDDRLAQLIGVSPNRQLQ